MSLEKRLIDKKNALLAQKQEILKEIANCDQKIELGACIAPEPKFVYEDSSDSDTEQPPLDTGPSLPELKRKELMLKTCLNATQELTDLRVLECEVTLCGEKPGIRTPPVEEPGVWREVIAECRIGIVPFSITFFSHRPIRKFAQTTYHILKVLPVKTAHEAELAKSVLPKLKTPSDVFEVIRGYAEAHRSRRNTLASLADKFGNSLYMEPLSDGGYTLKCAGLLEISWTVENPWTPVAPFHHHTKFNLEYMDEEYVKIIRQAHRQLSDPDLTTEGRTRLLVRIIDTCLQAQGPTQELHDSLSSDPETAETLKKRTVLVREPVVPNVRRKKDKQDGEIMAPPKSVPKKRKPQNNNSEDGNNTNNASVTSQISQKNIEDAAGALGHSGDAKKPKMSNAVEKSKTNSQKNGNDTSKLTGLNEKDVRNDADELSSVAAENTQRNSVASKKTVENDVENVNSNAKTVDNTDAVKVAGKKKVVKKIIRKVVRRRKTVVGGAQNSNENTNEVMNIETESVAKVGDKGDEEVVKSSEMGVVNTNKESNVAKVDGKGKKNVVEASETAVENHNEKVAEKGKVQDHRVDNVGKKIQKIKDNTKAKAFVQPKITNHNAKSIKPVTNTEATKRQSASSNDPQSSTNTKGLSKAGNNKIAKPVIRANNQIKTSNIVKPVIRPGNAPIKNHNKAKDVLKPKTFLSGKQKTAMKVGGIEKENKDLNRLKTSKIPLKKVGTDASVTKIPLRVSPRKPLLKPMFGPLHKTNTQRPVASAQKLPTKPGKR